jgi:hypothetical protein
MPRKRNKGRARKALKHTATAADWQSRSQSRGQGVSDAVPMKERLPVLQVSGPTLQHERDLISPANARLLFKRALEAQQVGSSCRHGCDSVPRTHACFLLKVGLDSEIGEQLTNGRSLIESLMRSFRIATQRCPQILEDCGTRESMKALYLAIGMFVVTIQRPPSYPNPICQCYVVISQVPNLLKGGLLVYTNRST